MADLIGIMDHPPGRRQFSDLPKLRAYICGKRGVSEDEFQQRLATQQALRAPGRRSP